MSVHPERLTNLIDFFAPHLQASKRPKGRKFEIEAFLAVRLDADLEPKVLVKFLDWDTAEWQPVPHLKDELSLRVLRGFLKDLQPRGIPQVGRR
jgi:hypothetical protein